MGTLGVALLLLPPSLPCRRREPGLTDRGRVVAAQEEEEERRQRMMQAAEQAARREMGADEYAEIVDVRNFNREDDVIVAR